MPLPEISCPSCGETEHLRGRRETKGLVITCDACGARWERDVRRRCRLCGSEDLRYTPCGSGAAATSGRRPHRRSHLATAEAADRALERREVGITCVTSPLRI